MKEKQGSDNTNSKAKRVIHDAKKINLEKPVIIALDDLDFSWNKDEVKVFLGRWRTGWPLENIAALLRPDLSTQDALDETMLLALHLYRQGCIEPKPGIILTD